MNNQQVAKYLKRYDEYNLVGKYEIEGEVTELYFDDYSSLIIVVDNEDGTALVSNYKLSLDDLKSASDHKFAYELLNNPDVNHNLSLDIDEKTKCDETWRIIQWLTSDVMSMPITPCGMANFFTKHYPDMFSTKLERL